MPGPTPPAHNGSQIWKLLLASLPFIQSHLSWSLGNGKDINISLDNILGGPPFEWDASLLPLHLWLSDQGKSSLYDISTWNKNIGKCLS